MPKVSVIITTRNRSHMLPRAIESVLNQTFKDYELIVVDDASLDDTSKVIKSYESRNCLLGLRIDKSRGANHARNEGQKIARGEYLAYLDDDDYWLPQKLEQQIAVFDLDSNVALVGCRFLEEGKVKELPKEFPYWALLMDNFIGGFSMCMFRKKDLTNVGGLDINLKNAQDWDLWLRLAELGKIVVVNQCLVQYNTGHTDRITVKKDRTAHYLNYSSVVTRHAYKMGYLTRCRHKFVIAYHTTPQTKPLLKVCRGGCYWMISVINKLIYKIRLRGSSIHNSLYMGV